jgi:mannose-1-phosphate guanylyltransferase
MQALVLVGGEGTRLRPLTLTQPKPALPLVDRPLIRHAVDWLGRHGVSDVVMACGFRPEALRSALGDAIPGGPRITYLSEPEPLGTAGPLRLAADRGLLDERFLALNGDVVADLDLGALVAAHAESPRIATLGLCPVEDPSSYGLVRRGADGEIRAFVEKPDPAEIDTDEINAGAYVLERSIVDLIPAGRAVSIEREVFPRLVGRGLYGFRLDGYWSDVGTPQRYLQVSWDILEGMVRTDYDPRDGGGPLIGDRAEAAADAIVGPRAIVGPGTVIGAGAVITESVLLDGCRIGESAHVRGSILAAGVEVGAGARIDPTSVVGEGARIVAGAQLGEDARVAPEEVVSA